jgi:hypothetical protein
LTKRPLVGSDRAIVVLVAGVAGGLSYGIREALDDWITFWPALLVSVSFVGLAVYVAALLLQKRT